MALIKENKKMSEGELGKRIKAKIGEGNSGFGDTKVSFAFGIAPILEEAKADFQKMYDEANKTFGVSYEEETQIWDAWFKKWFLGYEQNE
jgi:hypothetical protein